MNSFPLYELLYSRQEETNLNSAKIAEDLTFLIEKEKQLFNTTLSQELCYALIRMYFIRHEAGKILDLPTGVKKLKERNIGNDIVHDVTIDIKKFSPKLKSMIHDFIDLQSRKLDEDKKKLIL